MKSQKIPALHFLISAMLFCGLYFSESASAAVQKIPGVSFKKPLYLGEKESAALKDDLIASKFHDETFQLVFRCSKYKREPGAKSKTLNCIAMTVLPDPEVKPSDLSKPKKR